MKSEEIKSSIHKLKSEAHSEGVRVSKDGKDEGKGRVIKLPSIKDRLDRYTDMVPFKAFRDLKGKWNRNGEAEYDEKDEVDFYEKGDDIYMRPLPSWAYFTTNNPKLTVIIVGLITLGLLFQALTGEVRHGFQSQCKG